MDAHVPRRGFEACNTDTQGIGVEWNIVKDVGALWCRSSCPVKSREGIVQSHSRIRYKSARLICDRSFKCADLDLRSGGARLDQEDGGQTQQNDGTTQSSELFFP